MLSEFKNLIKLSEKVRKQLLQLIFPSSSYTSMNSVLKYYKKKKNQKHTKNFEKIILIFAIIQKQIKLYYLQQSYNLNFQNIKKNKNKVTK